MQVFVLTSLGFQLGKEKSQGCSQLQIWLYVVLLLF